MSKINHSRPYLNYIDNLRRELRKASSDNTGRKLSRPLKHDLNSRSSRPKRVTFWDKMAAIDLSEFEEVKINEVFSLLSDYYETSSEAISLILKKGSGKKRSKLKQKEEQLYSNLVRVSEELIISELSAQLEGREIGVFDWFNLLKPKLIRDGAEGVWDILNNKIFRDAMENIDARLDTNF